MIQTIPQSLDFFRLAGVDERGQGFKEWQHFVVHHDELRLIVNFNVAEAAWPERERGKTSLHRTIVLLHGRSTAERIERAEAVDVRSGAPSARIGGGQLRLERDAYRLDYVSDDGRLEVALRLEPQVAPLFFPDRSLSPGRRWSWLAVPHLRAEGSVTYGEERVVVRGAPSYHDHNWGCFWWGEDFCWDWISVVPDDPAEAAALVFRVLDGRRRIVRQQAVLLHDRFGTRRLFLGEQIRIAAGAERLPVRAAPAPLGLLLPCVPEGPARVVVEAQDAGDALRIELDHELGTRLLIPSEVSERGVVHLSEMLGHAVVRCRARGRTTEWKGKSVTERVQHGW